MKNVIIFVVFVVSAFSFAHEGDGRESHGSPMEERACAKEIRQLACGEPEQGELFMQCVQQKMASLSKPCQNFHRDEIERRQGK